MTETKNLIVSMMTNSHRKLYVHGIISFYSTAIGCFIAGLCNQLKILMLAGVLDLALGYHSMILKEDSSVWSTPVVLKGTSSTRGAGNYFLRVIPSGAIAVATGNYFSIVLKADGIVVSMGQNYQGQLGDGTRSRLDYFTVVDIVPGGKSVAAGGRQS